METKRYLVRNSSTGMFLQEELLKKPTESFGNNIKVRFLDSFSGAVTVKGGKTHLYRISPGSKDVVVEVETELPEEETRKLFSARGRRVYSVARIRRNKGSLFHFGSFEIKSFRPGVKPPSSRVQPTRMAISAMPIAAKDFAARITEALRTREWLMEFFIGKPFRIVLNFSKDFFSSRNLDEPLTDNATLQIDVGSFLEVQDENAANVDRISFLGLFPSGDVYSLPADLSQTESSIKMTLYDLEFFLDVDSANNKDELGQNRFSVDVIAVKAPDYEFRSH